MSLHLNKWRSKVLTLAMLTVVLAGCGSSGEPVGLLTGSIAVDGKPIDKCRVVVYEPTTLVNIGARVDESGKYELKNIPFGEYQVSVTPEPTNDAVYVPDRRIGRKYRNKDTSGITVSIQAVDTKVLDIALE